MKKRLALVLFFIFSFLKIQFVNAYQYTFPVDGKCTIPLNATIRVDSDLDFEEKYEMSLKEVVESVIAEFNSIPGGRDFIGEVVDDHGINFTGDNFGSAWANGNTSHTYITIPAGVDGVYDIMYDALELVGTPPDLELTSAYFTYDPNDTPLAAQQLGTTVLPELPRMDSDGRCIIQDAFMILANANTRFDIRSTVQHELGHMFGLEHTSAGVYNTRKSYSFRRYIDVVDIDDDGNPDERLHLANPVNSLEPVPYTHLPTMHFEGLDLGTTFHSYEADDKAGFRSLYPDPGFSTAYGRASGNVTRCEPDEFLPLEMDSVNIRLINVDNPRIQIARYTNFNGYSPGYFEIEGIPPGNYRIVVEPLGVNGANSGVMKYPIEPDTGFLPEYYSGAAELSLGCDETSPGDQEVITVAAGMETADIDIQVNTGARFTIVIDDTISMRNELDYVKSFTNTLIDSIESDFPDNFPKVALIRFKDDVTVPIISNDPDELRLLINSIEVGGGQDCREAAGSAAIQAALVTQPGGQVLLATDADNRGNSPALSLVRSYYASKGLTLFQLQMGRCVLLPEDQQQYPGHEISEPFPPTIVQNNNAPNGFGFINIENVLALQATVEELFGETDTLSAFADLAESTGGNFIVLPKPSTEQTSSRFEYTLGNVFNAFLKPSVIKAAPYDVRIAARFNIEIEGAKTNWNESSQLDFGDSGVIVHHVQVVSPRKLIADIEVPAVLTENHVSARVSTNLGASEIEIAQGQGVMNLTSLYGGSHVVSVIPTQFKTGDTHEVTIHVAGAELPDTPAIVFTTDEGIDSSITIQSVERVDQQTVRAIVVVDKDSHSGPRHVYLNGGFVRHDAIVVKKGFVQTQNIVLSSPVVMSRGERKNFSISGVGTNWNDSTRATLYSSDISIESTNVIDAEHLTVTALASGTARLGFYNLIVKTDGQIVNQIDAIKVIPILDSDDDGVNDTDDLCPNTSLNPKVNIGSCETSVANHQLGAGCAISDKIKQCSSQAVNHGKFVSCVSRLTNPLVSDGMITELEKDSIISCAAKKQR